MTLCQIASYTALIATCAREYDEGMLKFRILFSSVILCLPLAAAHAWSDVQAGVPLAAPAQYLNDQAIMQGYADGTFRPKQLVSRAEAVAIILRSAPASPTPAATGTAGFSDVSGDMWYASIIARAVAAGVIDGPSTSET